MAEDTDAKSDNTSEEDGKKTDDSAKGKDTDASKDQDADKKFTQADLDRVAKKTREEEKRKASEAKAKEDAERAEAKAKEQGEFEKLANDREAKIKELEPKIATLEEQLEAHRFAVAEIAKTELKALPEEVKDVAPVQYAEDKSIINPLEVLAWLPKGKALAVKLEVPGTTGVKPGPKPKGAPGNTETDKVARQQARQAYRD